MHYTTEIKDHLDIYFSYYLTETLCYNWCRLFHIKIPIYFMQQAVEIVLTAHPTQINRRTLQYKHIKIAVSSFSILEKIVYLW
jgi:hypothetical protein